FRQAVVAPRRPRAGLTPRRLDEPVAAEPAQERVDRALARDHPIRLGERADEIEAVPLFVDEQREDAVLERPLAHLRQKSVLLSDGYHASQGTWVSQLSQTAAGGVGRGKRPGHSASERVTVR